MNEYIQTKFFKVKLLTPVHISDGYEGELIPTEYVIDGNGQLHKIDLSKLIERLDQDALAKFNQLMDNEDLPGIRNFIRVLWQNDAILHEHCVQYSMKAGDLEDHYRNMQNDSVGNQFILTPFMRTDRKIYIPGSSIKGAFRTAFINELIKAPIAFDLDAGNIDKKALGLEWDTLNYRDRKNTRKPKTARDPFKTVKVCDCFTPQTNKGMVKKIDIVKQDCPGVYSIAEMKGVKLFNEVLDEGTQADIEIRLDKRYFEKRGSVGQYISFKKLMDSCKSFYSRVLVRERDAFFTGFDKTMECSNISRMYDEFIELNQKRGMFLLRIGKHIGRNSISFNLLNEKGIEPMSRKVLMNNGTYWPLGWVLVEER